MASRGPDPLEGLFKTVDVDGDGQINEADLKTFMKDQIGYDVDDEQIKTLVKELLSSAGSSASGRVDLPAFRAFFVKQLGLPLPGVLEDIFHIVDANDDGRISAAELVAFADRVKVKIGLDTAAYLLASGTDGKGQAPEADFQQFCNLVQRSLPSMGKGK